MVAKTAIIDSNRILREMREEERALSQDVATMAIALQWHVQSNKEEPVALSTSRTTDMDTANREVLLVLCDGKVERANDARLSSAAAQSIFDLFNNNTRDLDPAVRLSQAISRTLTLAHKNQTDSDNAHTQLNIVAAVVGQNKLTVSRAGKGRVYLMREGHVQNLTDESFASEGNEPDIGQLDLEGEDRVLLCTDAVAERLNEMQLRNILRANASARKATSALLSGANADETDDNMSVAVLDFVTGQTGTFQLEKFANGNGIAKGGIAKVTRSIATWIVLAALILAAAVVVPLLTSGQNSTTESASGDNIATLPAPPTAQKAIIAEPSSTRAAEPSPTIAPTSTPLPSATASPQPTTTATTTSTATPKPTDTPEPTATPTARPTRRPPTKTPTPEPTHTPEPSPTLILPTDTPVPPPSSGGGGGGNPPPPQNPCLPGAQCP
jgi:serine/threonine protein phosphatase PrpC